MATLLVSQRNFESHVTPAGHPERPDRIRVIEEALMVHPAVAEVNVIGVPDTYRGEAPVAYVKLAEGASVSESDLKLYLADKVNKIEMPREIIFRDELPKTLIGKLSKKELREDYRKLGARKSEPA